MSFIFLRSRSSSARAGRLPASDTARPPPGRGRLTAGLILTVTLVAFEALAVATILPIVGRQLGDLRLYGWVFSAYFLANLVGTAISGSLADRRGIVVPLLGGLVLFATGLAIGGTAPAMTVLVGGRVVQGLGGGSVFAAAYVAIGRAYADHERPRMLAIMSTAWVVPGLVGPVLAALVADSIGWRWVFLGLIPLVVASGALIGPALVGVPRPPVRDPRPTPSYGAPPPRQPADPPGPAGEPPAAPLGEPPAPAPEPSAPAARRAAPPAPPAPPPPHAPPAPPEQPPPAAHTPILPALGTATGAGAILAGLTLARAVPTAVLVVCGVLLGAPCLVRLVPAGTLRARPGLPAAVLSRGLLTFSFFSADSFLPYLLTTFRHQPTTLAGAALTASTLTWTAGAWIQARLVARVGPRRLVRFGQSAVVVAIATLALCLRSAVPPEVAVAAWAIGGLGMGTAYAPVSLTALDLSAAGAEGRATAAVNINDVLGTALGTGIAGAAVAAGSRAGDVAIGLLAALATAGAVGATGMVVGRGLPSTLRGKAADKKHGT